MKRKLKIMITEYCHNGDEGVSYVDVPLKFSSDENLSEKAEHLEKYLTECVQKFVEENK